MQFPISVLVPVYNVEDYIEKCARSLFNNTIASKCQFIFTNDCSTDSTIERLNKVIEDFPKLKKNIIVQHHEKNMGLGKTRNTGFDKAKGEYIICVDSDDWVEANYLEELLNKSNEGNYDVVGCDNFISPDYNYPDNAKEERIKKQVLNQDPKICLKDIYEDKTGSFVWIKLIKREFLIKNNIRWDDEISILEDMLICTKIFSNNPTVAYLPKALYHYVVRSGSYTTGFYNIEKADKFFLALSYINEYIKKMNVSYALEPYNILAYRIKYPILLNGTSSTQKKYLSIHKELNKYATLKNTKFIYYLVIKISSFSAKLAFCILHIFSLTKCMLRKISYNGYMEK